MHRRWRIIATFAALVVAATACTSGGDAGGRPSVVVTTSTLGDVVRTVAGSAASVTTIMPIGADPHDFQVSAQQAKAIRAADLLVVNGGGFEEGLADVLRSARDDGVRTFDALAAVPTIPRPGGGGLDPHFFTDPWRMETAVRRLLIALEETVSPDDVAGVRARVDEYTVALDALDREVAALLEPLPAPRRVLVTNHEVFAYFADRHRFEVVGVVVPGGSTDGGDAAALADLARTVREKGVPAIFTDASSNQDLARAIAGDVGSVQVVELFTESLGAPGSGGATYVEMVRTNAQRIASALG